MRRQPCRYEMFYPSCRVLSSVAAQPRNRLVYFETYQDVQIAIGREKQIKLGTGDAVPGTVPQPQHAKTARAGRLDRTP
jgi:hypothetical protein